MIPTLSAAAEVTSTIRLGPLVTSPNFRHPLLLAKDLLALDDISSGRLTIGVGSGGTGFDATVLGGVPWSAHERHARFDEFTRALDELLRASSSTLEGHFYPVVDSRQIPGPVQRPRPPIYLSALGPRSLALAAELADGWVSFATPASIPNQSTFASVAAQVDRLDEQLDRCGRARSSVHRVFLNFSDESATMASLSSFLEWAESYRSLGFDELVVHWPIADSQFDHQWDVFERIATEGREQLDRWI